MSDDNIEVHELFGFMVFTGSEGEDPRPAAFFPDEASAEAYVPARGVPVLPPGLSWVNPPEPLFEPSVVPCMARFASPYGWPDLPREVLAKALDNFCDDHEKRDWKELLRQTLPYVEGLAGHTPSDRLITLIKEAIK